MNSLLFDTVFHNEFVLTFYLFINILLFKCANNLILLEVQQKAYSNVMTSFLLGGGESLDNGLGFSKSIENYGSGKGEHRPFRFWTSVISGVQNRKKTIDKN